MCLAACIEPYIPPRIEESENPLVVEGLVDGNTGAVEVRLTTTASLDVGLPAPPVLNANVILESKGGATYPLFDAGGTGLYTRSGITVTPGEEFRVRIQRGGASYISDFVETRPAPPIDSVSFEVGADGIQVYVNTHDPDNEIGNYLWTYEETWSYTSAFESTVKYVNGVPMLREPEEFITTCYHNERSSTINNLSSEKLTENRVSKYALIFLPRPSEKLRIRYSILVRQFSIGREEHAFWTEMKKNSQNLGTLFDPLPTQVLGNLHNENDPSEPVLGYFRAGFSTEQRIFIANIDLPKDYHLPRDLEGCEEIMWPVSEISLFGLYPYLLTRAVYEGLAIIGYNYSTKYCVDCRLQGGTTTQPDFW